MIIRKAGLIDAVGIAKVHVDSWRTTYEGIVPKAFLDSLSYSDRQQRWERIIGESSVYVAEDENHQIIGFASGGKERTGKYADYVGELYAIYLLKEHHCKGIGKLLVQVVVDELIESKLHSMMIWALKENGACGFYEALGGTKVASGKIIFAGKELDEVAYGWQDLAVHFQ